MKPEQTTIKLSDVIFDETIYPRKEHDPALAQKYADTIDVIEASGKYISVSSDNKLLDGKHRWLGYRIANGDNQDIEIPAFVYATEDKNEQFSIAVKLNSSHGYQLSVNDKKQCAITMYGMGFSYDTIAENLSVGKKRISEWLSRTVKEEKNKRNERIFDLWLGCHTQQEIADAVGISREAIDKQSKSFGSSVLENQSTKTLANHADPDFQTPIYNVWKQQEKSNSVSHFGNSEVRWVDNLLYLYTDPFDVVVDPFAGGGSTIDICKKRFRRYFVSDRKPIVQREKEIRQHDIYVDGILKPPQWKDVKLVYLDPPYWIQAEGQYSNDPSDLGNMDLEKFTKTLAQVIKGYAAKLSDAYIALIIQPTQWKAPDRQFTDHIGDMLREVKLPVDMRFSVPYESQQCNAQQVEWAKENKRCLVLTREIVVWRVK